MSVAAVTIATSKVKPGPNILEPHVTNYYVTSNCLNKISEAKIRVNNSAIVEANYPAKTLQDNNGQNYETRSFEDFGFQYYNVPVGEDLIGKFELSGRDCLIKNKEFLINEQYDKAAKEYWFYRPGYFTKTTYHCYHNNVYQCAINLEELPAVDFKTIISDGSL
jgi:hypothetical protein